jgi:hypothetical protein
MDMQDPAPRPRTSQDLRVDAARFPESVSGAERVPVRGERVFTNEGTAVVIALHGRTGSGGRLLELKMDDGRRASFFAAADNVRVAAAGGVAIPVAVGDLI